MMRDSVEDKKDLWLIYELAPGKTMNEHLFEVKGEFYKGERIYMVHHSNFYHCLRSNITLLKEFIYRMTVALSMFARMGIVHADLKPENILVEYDQ
jgi:serine/threonine protein kinase